MCWEFNLSHIHFSQMVYDSPDLITGTGTAQGTASSRVSGLKRWLLPLWANKENVASQELSPHHINSPSSTGFPKPWHVNSQQGCLFKVQSLMGKPSGIIEAGEDSTVYGKSWHSCIWQTLLSICILSLHAFPGNRIDDLGIPSAMLSGPALRG